MTAERIVAAALALTREHGLEEWTVRQLASAVRAYPAVVYHHVGDREAVVAAVIDVVVAEIPLPADELPWRQWFEEVLVSARPVLRAAPGVARRLALHGPMVPSAVRIIDRGVRVLQRAGFGDEAVPVFTLLLNQTCQAVALEDDRARLPAVWATYDSFHDRADLPGLAEMSRYLRDRAGVFDAESFAYGVARTLDGVAARRTATP